MLDGLFLQILNMSVTASYVIVFVLLARLLLKRAPKVFPYALWSVVLFRLVSPLSFESKLSWLSLTGRTMEELRPFPQGFAAPGTATTPIPAVAELLPVAPPPIVSWFTLLWLVGVAALLLYSVIALLRLNAKLVGAVKLRENIYLADHIQTAFVLGLPRPWPLARATSRAA